MLQKMMRRFDASDEHANELRGYLANIREKVDAHSIFINHLVLQMAQLFPIVNPRQPGTLPSNTIQNPKNDGHCMAVTTRGGQQTINQTMQSAIEEEVQKVDEVLQDNG